MSGLRGACGRSFRALVGMMFAAPLLALGNVFYEVEVVTEAAPASEYAKLAAMTHDLCNQLRKQAHLPPKPFPILPSPFLMEHLWTLSNGVDYVLRKRDWRLEPGGSDPEDCDMRLAWTETTTITRGGQTTEITRSSNGFSEINRDAFTSPWRQEKDFSAYPESRMAAVGLVLRCARLGRDALPVPVPMLNATRLCIAQKPAVFRDAFGHSLLMEYEGDGKFFEGRGGKFSVTARTRGFGTRNPTNATWDPNTYLRD